MSRQCMWCPAEIDACMGHVLARDFLAAANGSIPWTAVRELCARCVFLWEQRLGLLELLAERSGRAGSFG